MYFGFLGECSLTKIFIESKEIIIEQEPPWSKYNREMKSRLVVASNRGQGCVLYAIGSCWEAWHEGSGSYRLEDNGLDDAPDGISIWEGRMLSWGPDRDGEYDAELRGEFRELTAYEWALLSGGEAPWYEEDWLVKDEKEMEVKCQD